MRRSLVAILILLIGLNSVVQPGGYVTSSSLHEMYQQCGIEDPDLNPVDFVFEHLLNLEDLMHHFEGEDEEEESEQPHTPYQFLQTTVQFVASVPKPIIVNIPVQKDILADAFSYPLPKDDLYVCNFSADIFHPPIV